MTKSYDDFCEEQRAFYHSKQAGCSFASVASHDMAKFGWKQICLEPLAAAMDRAITEAASDDNTSTLSLIFPSVTSDHELVSLVNEATPSSVLAIESVERWNGLDLVRMRAHFNSLTAWVTGFGPFAFLPITRRSPHTELALRVAPRPDYDWHFTDYPDDVVHLADMRMVGRKEQDLLRLWDASFKRTARALGHPADAASAAKTTFALPLELSAQLAND